MRLLASSALLLTAALFASPVLYAQNPNRVTQRVDVAQVRALPNHVPAWANPANAVSLVPQDLVLDQMTIVLSRSPQQQLAFEAFLAAQQDPGSPDYHHWLTPLEVGDRFGLSPQDLDAVTGWLQSQGLQVNWTSPSRIFISFKGTFTDVARAFQTELRYYNVNGVQRMSISSDPNVPAALAPVIQAVRGLSTVEDLPLSRVRAVQSDSPEVTVGSGSHYLAPSDFAAIYDVPANLTGAGVTIGILGEARTNFADFANFRKLTGATFSNPTEIVPTAYGGVDPGPAYTAPPAAGVSTAAQGEATLDVFRSGSVAPGANILLVTSRTGLDVDAQYVVNTSPVPAQIMSISFGGCELRSGASGVAFWDTLFQQGAAEGISAFVASGDSGASGCDPNFSPPPATPLANSPNYVCSSSYATCVGGTEFNDASNSSLYWNSSNSLSLDSARGYIPEGAWNEPLDANSNPQVVATGGGVSIYVATPSWQTGTGVPAARSGRYTPDISFSASGHDGYIGCNASQGGDCVPNSSGITSFLIYSGTSASAPGMAGVAALLDQKLAAAQGNLNPQIYQVAASIPSAFHDTTVATSGVASCNVNTPSLCNNSIAGSTGLAASQAGYLVTTGYDEATGLGSLDVNIFLNNYVTSTTPVITFTVPNHIFGDAPFIVSATSNSPGAINYSVVSGPATISGATVTLTAIGTVVLQASQAASGSFIAGSQTTTFTVAGKPQTISFTGPATQINYGTAPVPLSATASSGLPVTFHLVSGPASVSGSTLTITGAGTVVVAADQAGNTIYAPAPEITRTIQITLITPAVSMTASPNPALALSVVTLTATVASAASTPTGTVAFSNNGVIFSTATLNGGTATVTTTTLAGGMHTLTAEYQGDSNFNTAYSTAVSETIQDFSLNAAGTTLSDTVSAGATATYVLPISAVGSTTLPAAVTFSASGQPSGATVTFSPTSLAAGSTATSVTLTIQVPQTATLENLSHPGSAIPLAALGLLLLPFMGRIKRSRKQSERYLWLLLFLAGMGTIAGLMGCSASGNNTS